MRRISRYLSEMGHQVAYYGWFANDYRNAGRYIPLSVFRHYSTIKTHVGCGCCDTPGLFIDRMDSSGNMDFFEVNMENHTVFPSTRLKCSRGRCIPVDKYGLHSFSVVVSDFKPDLVLSLGDLWMVESYTRGELRKYYSLVSYLPVDGDPLPSFTSQTNALIDYGGYDIDWKRTLKNMDRIVAYTEYGKNTINALLEEERCKDFIWHGCDTKNLYPMSIEERRELVPAFFGKTSMKLMTGENPKVTPDDIVITCVSRNQPRKGYPYLFEGVARLIPRVNKKVYLYCHAPEQDCGWNFIDLAKQYGITENVIVDKALHVGSGVTDDDMRKVYNASTLMALATRGEGWGLGASESMACGIPVVTTPYSGHGSPGGWALGCFEEMPIKASDREPITGINRVIPDVDGITDALEHALQPERYNELVKLGLAKAKELDWDNILPKWAHLIGTTPLKHERYPVKEHKQDRVISPSAWPSNPVVSIVLPVSVMVNTPQYDRIIKRCITSLDRQTYRPWELIIIDNIAHGPDTVDYLNKIRHTVVRWPYKYHAPSVLNKGVTYTHGEYLLFLHSDVVLSDECVTRMMNVMKLRGDAGVVGGAIFDEKKSRRQVGYGYSLLQEIVPNYGEGQGLALCEGVSGACLLISRELFNSLNGFDEEYLADYWDLDLCQQARSAGRNILVDTAAEVIHTGNLTRRYHQRSTDIMDSRRFYDKFGSVLLSKKVS